MKLLIINKAIRDKVRGLYEKHHELKPVFIENGFYILNHDNIIVIKPKLKDDKYKDIPGLWFTVGDGSPFDLKYQKYLNA